MGGTNMIGEGVGEMREGGTRDHLLLGEEMMTTSVDRFEGETMIVIETGTGTRGGGETTTGIIEEVGRNRMIVDRGIREEGEI